jgi:hypothetical protein
MGEDHGFSLAPQAIDFSEKVEPFEALGLNRHF